MFESRRGKGGGGARKKIGRRVRDLTALSTRITAGYGGGGASTPLHAVVAMSLLRHAMSVLPHRNWVLTNLHGNILVQATYADMQTWQQWQAEVVAALSAELGDLPTPVAQEDVDWGAWYGFFLEGRSPKAAVDRALERDL